MAIRLTLNKTERILFCGSKWWGDPDMPHDMQYPMVSATEDGETFEYPLTFICQINCEDIAALEQRYILNARYGGGDVASKSEYESLQEV